MKKVIAYASGTVVFIASMLLGFPYIQNAGHSEAPTPIEHTVVRIQVNGEHGSGVLITPTVVITAKHVVDKAKNDDIKITDYSGGVHHVIGIRVSGNNDFAIVLLDKPVTYIQPAKTSCEKVNVLDKLYVVGYPLDFDRMTFENTVVAYVENDNVSEGEKLLATGVVLPGDSGGPVFNKDGEVVGVVSGEYMMGNADNPAASTDTDLNMFVPLTVTEVCGV